MPNVPSSLATLATVIRQGIDNRLRDVHTAMPGIVVSFESSTQLARVQPAIRRLMKTDDGENEILVPTNLPQLLNVPVIFPRGGDFMMTMPVQSGDEVLIIFSERPIDNWYTSGGVQTPSVRRFHSLSDAVAIPGLNSKPRTIPSYNNSEAEFRNEAGDVVVNISNNKMTLTAETVEINSDQFTVNSTLSDINSVTNVNAAMTVTGAATLTGGAAVSGSMLNNGTNIGSTHKHTQGNDSNGDVQQNTGNPF